MRPNIKGPNFQNPVCQACIKRQLEKYDGYVDEDGNTYGEFSIQCRGIPEQHIDEGLAKTLTDEQRQEIIGLFDPVVWAENWCKLPDGSPWVARWYQADILRCTARRRVTRLGRRVGKCLEEGTQIMTPSGPVEIQNLRPGDMVYAYDVETDSVFPAPVKALHDQGLQEVVDLKYKGKKIVSCTPIHRWHTTNSTRKDLKGVLRLNEFSRDTAITRKYVDGMCEFNDSLPDDGKDFVWLDFNLDERRIAQCWDITLDTKDSLYLTADGLVTHNTDMIAIHTLHFCMTNQNKRILIIAPYKSQTEEIITRIKGFIRGNPKLQASVKRERNSPFYEIVFWNGSRIRGFSSGTKSGGESTGIRGQDADRIYLDEAAFLDAGDLRAITAILTTNAHVDLWGSSTPTGAHTHFWNWCEQSPTYKEFHFPSSVLPFWDEVKDQLRADYAGDPQGWQHEIEAEWGEEAVGVFQHAYIEDSKSSHKYEEQYHLPGWTYVVGVDWNTNFGTEIVVVGYGGNGQFKVVSAVNIPKQGWTQLAGINAVTEINKLWLPAFIYVDEGAGATNIELLRKHAYDLMAVDPKNPGVRLKDIVKSYNFSSKIEIRDPVTGKIIKKHAKPFMVENAVRFFEERRILISSWDTVLVKQLENYIIKRRTPGNVPIYGLRDESVGDHRLDALMLALVGFKLEMSYFGNPRITTHVEVASPGFLGSSNEDYRKTQREQYLKRLERIPQERFPDQTKETVFTAESKELPGRVSGGQAEVPDYKHGFMTDEEDKYMLKYKLRRARKRARFFRAKPKRTNI